MNFEEFKQKIVLAVGQRTSGTVEIHEARKTNDVKRTGLMITEQGTCISPIVYLEKCYEDFCGGKDFDDVVLDIMEMHLEGKNAELDITWFTEWEKAGQRVLVKLVNYEANTELLKDVPHRRFLNLAEVYYIIMDIGGGQGMGSILVHNMHLGLWGIGEEELAETAYANYQRFLPAEIMSMDEIVMGLAGIRMLPEPMPEMPKMYIATNRWKLNGAAVMLFPEMLRTLADRWKCDLYILPSSVNEVILLPVRTGETKEKEELAEIVEEVNQTQVILEEKLSDTVYRYSCERGEVVLA